MQQLFALKHALANAPTILNGSFVNNGIFYSDASSHRASSHSVLAVSPAALITSAGSDSTRHMHEVTVPGSLVELLSAGQSVMIDSEQVNGHTHTIKLTAAKVPYRVDIVVFSLPSHISGRSVML